MLTLTEIVNGLIVRMGEREQIDFLKSMKAGERPGKRLIPKTKKEIWWYRKLGQGARADFQWELQVPAADLLAEFMEAMDWKESKRGARVALGILVKRLCPSIRLVEGVYLMPPLDLAREDFLKVCPGPGQPAPQGARIMRIVE